MPFGFIMMSVFRNYLSFLCTFFLLGTCSFACAQKGYFTIISTADLPFQACLNNRCSDSLVNYYSLQHKNSEVILLKLRIPGIPTEHEKLLFINMGKSYTYMIEADGQLTLKEESESTTFYGFDFEAPLFTFEENNDAVKQAQETDISLPELDNPIPDFPISKNFDENNCNILVEKDFNEALHFIKSAQFSESRLSIAKQITESNCITSNQLLAIVYLFKHENSRLDFLQFAYDYLVDTRNYGLGINALRYEYTRNKFLRFLEEAGQQK